ncbi:MAG TPA: glycosyltransferase [Vicinamibacterales bacterium]|nr:glycosyltransferase [Vicinamibacterales bacterium]
MNEGPLPFPDDVDIGIVSHNGRVLLPRVLDCLTAAGAPDDRIAVYDVGSTDGTREWLAEARPAITVRRLDTNVGPDPGRNWATREARRPYLLLLDADALVEPDCPARLRAAITRRPGIGTVAPVVVHAEAPGTLQYASGHLHFICEAVNQFLDRPLGERGHDARPIGAAPAVALLIDVAVSHAIGNWDDRYFIGKEDGDFCHRLRMGGYDLVEDPAAIVRHETKPRTAWLFPCQIRNRWHFLLKNYEARTLFVLAPALALHEVLQFGLLASSGHFGAWVKAVGGLLPWLRTLPAERRVIQGRRRRSDRELLVCAPLIVRADLAGGPVRRHVKRWYDAWLDGYWRVCRHLLS